MAINRLSPPELDDDFTLAVRELVGYTDRQVATLRSRAEANEVRVKELETSLEETVGTVVELRAENTRLQEYIAGFEASRAQDRSDQLGMVKALQQAREAGTGSDPMLVAAMAQSLSDRMDKMLSEQAAAHEIRCKQLADQCQECYAHNAALKQELEQLREEQKTNREETKEEFKSWIGQLAAAEQSWADRHKDLKEFIKAMPVPVTNVENHLPQLVSQTVLPEGAIKVLTEVTGKFIPPEPRKTTVEKSIVYAPDGSGRPDKIIETRTEE